MSGNIAALRLKNRIYAGTLAGAELQAELADSHQLGAWRQLCTEGESIVQMLSVPELRPVLQASPAAADEILRAGYAVGRALEVLLPSPSAELRACNTFDRLLANPANVQRLMGSTACLSFLMSSPWGMAAFRAAFASHVNASGGVSLLNLIITSQQILDFVNADPALAAAFRTATALTKSEVPQQTGNNTGGQVSASNYYSSNYPHYAFDKGESSVWLSYIANNQWIRFSFTNPVFVHTVSLNNAGTANTGAKNVVIQCSPDGTNWMDLLTMQLPQSSSKQTRTIGKAGRFAHWRAMCLDNWGHANYLSLAELNFIGFQ